MRVNETGSNNAVSERFLAKWMMVLTDDLVRFNEKFMKGRKSPRSQHRRPCQKSTDGLASRALCLSESKTNKKWHSSSKISYIDFEMLTYGSDQRVNETCSNAGSYVSNGQNEVFGSAL